MTRRDFLKALGAAIAVVTLPSLVVDLDETWTICTVTEPIAFQGGRTHILIEGRRLHSSVQAAVVEGFRQGMIRGFGFHTMPRSYRAEFLRAMQIGEERES